LERYDSLWGGGYSSESQKDVERSASSSGSGVSEKELTKAMNAQKTQQTSFFVLGFVANYSSIVLQFHKGGSMKSEWWRSN